MDKEKLNDILQKHKKWLNGEDGGERADLRFVNLINANLSGAKLSGADLSGAILRYAKLSGANLSDANLSYADLRYANLSDANLSDANLSYASLRYADLRFVNLINANLSGAKLSGADLSGAILRYANLSGAKLSGANLIDATVSSITAFYHLQCPEKGSFTAFKKLKDNLIAELRIPAKAKRSSATSRKCRASEAKVIKIWNYKTNEVFKSGVSQHDSNFIYEVGKTVKPTEKFNEDRWDECASGIHFFMTLQEAEDY